LFEEHDVEDPQEPIKKKNPVGKRCFRWEDVCNDKMESKCPNAAPLDQEFCKSKGNSTILH
jgi:hypothetical protein